ncbi:uncharacterized protein LOC126983848 [Eriocheir sinensis]|uniref:uncharacterized protein LOC126983848 n=1 Tax=Eriocheir sinensis TaxID=95602 RepID=UPI0021C5AED0|nr:uncharacterized protein LOC126983848 [Eriocheir sinensis]
MKQFVSILLLALCLASASALPKDTLSNALKENGVGDEDEGAGRFGFLTVNEEGAKLTFNSTSLQYAVVIGVVLLILGLVVIPLIGFDVAKLFSPRDSYDNHYGYDTNNYSSYTSYAKRSLDVLSPVLTALAEGYKKYD